MKKLGKILLTILEIAIIIYVIFVTTCLLCKNKYGYTQFGKSTLISINDDNSAELVDFESGNLVIVDSAKFNNIEAEDELYYYDTVGNSYVIRKGKVSEKSGDSYSAVYVIDNNSISNDRIIGKFSKKYSSLGLILDILESRIGFLLIVILPIFLLFIYQIYKMVVLVKYDDTKKEI